MCSRNLRSVLRVVHVFGRSVRWKLRLRVPLSNPVPNTSQHSSLGLHVEKLSKIGVVIIRASAKAKSVETIGGHDVARLDEHATFVEHVGLDGLCDEFDAVGRDGGVFAIILDNNLSTEDALPPDEFESVDDLNLPAKVRVYFAVVTARVQRRYVVDVGTEVHPPRRWVLRRVRSATAQAWNISMSDADLPTNGPM